MKVAQISMEWLGLKALNKLSYILQTSKIKPSVLLSILFFSTFSCKTIDHSKLASDSQTKKVVIFYASMGSGHLSASKAIQAELQQRYPNIEVELKDIREFYGSQTQERISREVFWFTVKNFPSIFDRAYRKTMDRYNQAPNLEMIGLPYNLEQVSGYLKQANPDVIISTHYGTSLAISSMRDHKMIDPTVKVGWLHTDYCEACFPRISKSVDMTFLPHNKLEEVWLDRGVPKEMMQTTGMPLNPKLFEPLDKQDFLRKSGLNPDIPLITLASGAEGVGNFPEIARQIAQAFGESPVQLFVATAKSEKNRQGLEALRSSLPPQFNMIVEGMVPQERLLNMIKSSDVYITKAGGLSPTEGFAINVPMILLDIYGGHEHDNALLFEKLELASIVNKETEVGEKLQKLLGDADFRKRMIASQRQFRGTLDVNRIIDFAVSGRKELAEGQVEFVTSEFQEKNRENYRRALAELQDASRGQVELLLSDSVEVAERGVKKSYYSSVALRIGDRVILHSENNKALHSISYLDYLHYPPSQQGINGLELGVDYGVTNHGAAVGLRIDGFNNSELSTLQQHVNDIIAENRQAPNQKFPACQCDNVVAEALTRMGLKRPSILKSLYGGLDYFDYYHNIFTNNSKFGIELISYAQNHNAGQKSGLTISRTPVSLFHPLRMFSTLFKGTRYDPKFAKRVQSYSSNENVYMENLNQRSDREISERLANERQQLEQRRSELITQENELKRIFEHSRSSVEMMYENAAVSTISNNQSDSQRQDQMRKTTQEAYDNFLQKKLEYFVDLTHVKVHELHHEYRNKAAPKAGDQMEKIFQNILSNYAEYKEKLGLYGQAKDVERISAQRQFYKNYQNLLNLIESINHPTAGIQSFVGRLYNMMYDLWSKFVLVAKVVPKVSNILYSLQFQAKTKPGETPLIDSVYQGFDQLGKIFDLKVRYRGLLNLVPPPGTPSERTVNIFALQHSHPQLDNILLARLAHEKIKRKFAVFGASDYFGFPKAIADRFNINDSFITVGRGSDYPIEKSVQILREKNLRDLVIFPEGSVSAGLYDNRPLRSKFSWGLVQRLQKEGYLVNIIPVAFPKNFTFNTQMPSSGFTLDVDVLPPIDDQTIRKIVTDTGDWEALNRLIRDGYLQKLQQHNIDFLGMPDTQVLEKQLGLRSSCLDVAVGLP